MIRYYEGVEGSGKTCMLTRDLYRHKMYGGRVLSLPGYELFGRTKKSVLSEVIMPEQILEMISATDTDYIRKQRIVIAMDEVTNFFSHHNWNNKICDILTAVLAERRKLGIAVLMTGPEEDFLPKDIRFMLHELVHCTNSHSFNRDIPSSLLCMYYKEDRRGMLSHPSRRFTTKHKFYMSKWHKHYDTYSAVGFNHNLRIKIQNREVVYDADGNRIDNNNDLDTSLLEGIMGNYQPKTDPRIEKVKNVVAYLKERGLEQVESYVLSKMLPEYKLNGTNSIGSILKSMGVVYIKWLKVYDLTNVTN